LLRENEVLGSLVPSLVLQPLVENAILMAMADRAEVGHVEIRAAWDKEMLTLEVQDDGPGLSESNGPKRMGHFDWQTP